ncbi:hypothetical protein ACFWM3_19135 [Gottfriedia sp. NPDC058432]|uniref:hypothetical protein n=1 Tax=Gottfriedia sp. NPDC058432 TaxID=3346497 RepID=UPI003669FA88
MIYIKRTQEPSCLKKDTLSAGYLETQRAISHYSSKKTEEFNFIVYKDVKEELVNMFNGKCAYCETKIVDTQYPHIEHYRPKGKIVGEPIKDPGYYWLASDWENLLLACQVCNGQEFKGNHFPLKVTANRVKDHTGNVENEEPLLINPCIEEHPEDHFRFTDNGEIIGIDDLGKTSIEVYGLHRPNLIQSRFEHLLDINLHLDNLQTLINLMDGINEESKFDKVVAQIRNIIKHLKSFKNAEAKYAAMTRDFIDKRFIDLIHLLE